MATQIGRREKASADVSVAATSTPAFVGRDDAMAKVTEALEHGPSLVLIEGEAGIGKTRLLREALSSPSVQGRKVLVAACPALPEPFPLGAVVDGLRRLRPDVPALGLSRLGGALRPVFPEWDEALPPALEPLDDPKETRHRVLRALTELVECLGVELLVVEDAHWADAATLEWLLTLGASSPAVDDRRPSVVVSYRPDDVPDGSLLLRLGSRPSAGQDFARIMLEPLDVEQTRRLVASMFRTGEVSDEFAAFLHQRTDGVPLAVEECVLLLRDRHDIVRRGPAWIRRVLDELEAPPSVRDSVLERIARLRPEARRVLEAAAILAGPSDAATLTAVTGLDDEAGSRGLAAALASGLLQETGPDRYVFRHALDAQAIGDAIPASERRHLHTLAAAALAVWDPLPVARLAHHYREAGNTEQWCHYAEQAADLALASGDDHTAVTVLMGALTGTEHPIERQVRLARKLGEAAFFGTAALSDLVHQVVDALRVVLNTGELPKDERGELRLLLGRMSWRTGEGVSAFEEIEAAIPDLERRPDLAMRAMIDLAFPFVPDWPASRHRYWLDRAGELLDHVPETHKFVLADSRATVLLLLGDEAGWEVADEFAMKAAGTRGDTQIALELLNVAWSTLVWGRYDDTRRRVATAVEYVEQMDQGRLASNARVAQIYLDWYTGAWHGLRTTASELAISDDNDASEQLQARQVLGLLELAAGRRADALKNLRHVFEAHTRRRVVDPTTVLASAGLGRLHLADSDAGMTVAVTEPVMRMIATKQVWLWATDIAPVHLDALVAAGMRGDAEELVSRFADGLAGRDAPAPAAALMLCRGMVAEARGEWGEAAELFAQAASAWAALPRPYDELLALERRGRCLLAAGDQDEALELLVEVKERLDELGARWDADRLAQLLRGHGVDVARAWRGGRRGYGDELSPREQEVVGLVARGMTNKQIAKTLFLSPRTVERHLRHSMRKLDVSSRTALAIAASEAGLIADESTPAPTPEAPV